MPTESLASPRNSILLMEARSLFYRLRRTITTGLTHEGWHYSAHSVRSAHRQSTWVMHMRHPFSWASRGVGVSSPVTTQFPCTFPSGIWAGATAGLCSAPPLNDVGTG